MEATAQSKHWLQARRIDQSEWNCGKRAGTGREQTQKSWYKKWSEYTMALKESQGKEFFEQRPDCKQVCDHELSSGFLFNLAVFREAGPCL